MRYLFLFFLCAICFCLGFLSNTYFSRRLLESSQQVVFEKQPHPSLHLFAMLGQSNMSGTGRFPYPQMEDPRIFAFGNDYRWKVARPPIDHPHGQVDLVSLDPKPGFGLGLPFARTVLQHQPSARIGLIPCALSGSTLHQWKPNRSDQSLYGSCLKRIFAASSLGRLRAILFFQGEADALDPVQFAQRRPNAKQWGFHFQHIVRALRRDLSNPTLPILFAQIGKDPHLSITPHWREVQLQQANIQLPHTQRIVTHDLPLADAFHLSNQGYIAAGQRFAKAYLQLIRSPRIP